MTGLPPRTKLLTDVTVITDPQERAQAINDRDDVWKALRERLAPLRKDKCWYCESNDSRSDRPIDHYRPKNAIAECDDSWGILVACICLGQFSLLLYVL